MEKQRYPGCCPNVWTLAVNTTDPQETVGEKGMLKNYQKVYINGYFLLMNLSSTWVWQGNWKVEEETAILLQNKCTFATAPQDAFGNILSNYEHNRKLHLQQSSLKTGISATKIKWFAHFCKLFSNKKSVLQKLRLPRETCVCEDTHWNAINK